MSVLAATASLTLILLVLAAALRPEGDAAATPRDPFDHREPPERTAPIPHERVAAGRARAPAPTSSPWKPPCAVTGGRSSA